MPPADTSDFAEWQIHDGFSESGYEVYDDRIVVFDAVWGTCEIGSQPGDEVLLDLLHNPLIRRLMSVEQLTLPASLSTIPNTSFYSRWEHAWGSVVFVRKMTEAMALEPRDRTILQLRTFLSGVGHTAFSHLGDWLFQGFGGAEDQHDTELATILVAGGIADILEQHGIAVQEIVPDNPHDWVESSAPELCVDRVDYGAREIQRWLNLDPAIHASLCAEAFQVTQEGQLVINSYKQALAFARAFALLPTEHWGEPVHRLQELLMVEMVKRVFVADEGLMVDWMDASKEYHPRDYLYTVDWDMLLSMRKVDAFSWVMTNVMEDMARAQRRIFTQVRVHDLRHRLGAADNPAFPRSKEGLSFQGKLHPLTPANIQIIPVNQAADIADFGEHPATLDFDLPPLKPRYVDPLFVDESGQIHRLSDYDPTFKQSLAQQKMAMAQRHVARVYITPEYKKIIEEGLLVNAEVWPQLLQKPEMPRERFVELLRDSKALTGFNLIRLRWLA